MADLYVVVVFCVMFCPLSMIAIFLSVVLNRTLFHKEYWANLIFAVLGGILFYIGYLKDLPIIPLEKAREFIGSMFPFLHWRYHHITLQDWLASDFRTIGATVTAQMLCLFLAAQTPEKIMEREEMRRQCAKMHKQKIEYVPTKNQICFGVSGSGKTVFLSKSIEEILLQDPDAAIIVVDGKGSCERYSLHYNLQIIAKKTGKKLRIINGTDNDDLGQDLVYDFLADVANPDIMKDLVMTLIDDPEVDASAASYHYKIMTERYILVFIEFMVKHKVDVTLLNLTQILDPDDLENAFSYIDADVNAQTEIMTFARRNWADVRANVEKLKMLLTGQGRKLFMGDGERINLRSAFDEGAIILVLADTMSMSSIASRLVLTCTQDLRLLIGQRLTGKADLSRSLYVFYDEINSYRSTTGLIFDIYSKCRSAGKTVMTIATQSTYDVIALFEGCYEKLLNTANRFVLFRQHGNAAEAAATMFGTESSVSVTSRSSDMQITGESSNTLERSFIVHPDTIRKLKKNHGFLLDMDNEEHKQLQYFKNKFVKNDAKKR